MTSESYQVPLAGEDVVYETKKSRFIARVAHITNKEDARAFVELAKQNYPDARHHCWAYQIGSPQSPSSAAMSDDGEPSGTAGKPILNVLQHKDIGDIMIVVTRYFGGIKLGAGGLVRAYSNAAQLAIEHLKTKKEIATIPISVQCDFAQEQTVRHWLSLILSQNLQADYQQQVVLQADIPGDQFHSLENKCHSLGITIHQCS